ncbi:MAG: lycopene beta-cyclase CrtY [Alphaproteobacteria bacterium]|nr:lycopene beta-cyclase CrtY [Alphaproteobacteria bacterium]
MGQQHYDLAILGGGLAGGLLTLALSESRPELSLLLVDGGATFGGNHVWSFFASDVDERGRALTDPLVAARWPGYEVHFAHHSRSLATPYRSITSERLDARLREVLPASALLTGVRVANAGPESLSLADGRTFTAGGVIDARGAASLPHMAGGWQKFLGQTLRLATPHGLSRPVVMDARVEQIDGYRFVYCLPFSDTEVFVEDTYYSDTPDLDREALRAQIADYASARGWFVVAASREETGVLPVVATGDFDAFWPAGDPLARIGNRAALFHPLTSYSLPIAVRTALAISRLPDLSGPALARASREMACRHWQDGAPYRMLTRLLFGAAPPERRAPILERFYRLSEPLIQRFYASRTSRSDLLRILTGKPPVPIPAALAALAGRGRPLAPLEIT